MIDVVVTLAGAAVAVLVVAILVDRQPKTDAGRRTICIFGKSNSSVEHGAGGVGSASLPAG